MSLLYGCAHGRRASAAAERTIERPGPPRRQADGRPLVPLEGLSQKTLICGTGLQPIVSMVASEWPVEKADSPGPNYLSSGS